VSHLSTCVECRRVVAHPTADSFVGRFRQADTNVPASGNAKSEVLPELANHPDYRIVRELGRGGMDRDEVLKVGHREMMERPGAADRFLQEIRSAA
jgi:hypothetical protein